MDIPFNKPGTTGNEIRYLREAVMSGHLSGDGPFTRKCQDWLELNLECTRAFLTPSGTAALEMAAILLDVRPGDEIIMPSYTFVSTANAFALRGGVPVFIDIRPDTLNIDELLIERAITKKTRVIVPVHYAGVSCEMDAILNIAEKWNLDVIEDASHALFSRYKGRSLGSLGRLGTLSFHETKNLHCGEGGALLINDGGLLEQAEILWQKGTDRLKYVRGEVDKYRWVALGSSYVMSEITASFLYAQLEMARVIQTRRFALWQCYNKGFAPLEAEGRVRLPVIPDGCAHNAHLYYLLLPDEDWRDKVIRHLQGRGVEAIFHYVPLHDSPGGRRFARTSGPLTNTLKKSAQIIRLPLWIGMEGLIDRVIDEVCKAVRSL